MDQAYFPNNTQIGPGTLMILRVGKLSSPVL